MPYKNKSDLRAYEKRRNATPRRRAMRSKNVLARRKMAKKLDESAIRGKDVHHIRPISKGGGNNVKNLRAVSPSWNRANRSNTKKKTRTLKKT
jgi:hypothetical protein